MAALESLLCMLSMGLQGCVISFGSADVPCKNRRRGERRQLDSTLLFVARSACRRVELARESNEGARRNAPRTSGVAAVVRFAAH